MPQVNKPMPIREFQIIVRGDPSRVIPRNLQKSSMMEPAIRKRVPARKSAGISLAPMRMAKYVEPQKIYTQAKASTTAKRVLATDEGFDAEEATPYGSGEGRMPRFQLAYPA